MQSKLVFSIPYIISFLMSAGIGLYSLWRRRNDAALPFAVMVLSQASWTMGFIVELYSPILAQKIFWDSFQYIPGIGWLLGFLAFSLRYSGIKVRYPKLLYPAIALLPIVVSIASFVDVGGLIRSDIALIPGEPFGTLAYQFGPLVYIWAAYGYVLAIVCTGIIIRALAGHLYNFKRQGTMVIVGNLIPLLATLLPILGISPFFHRDITPITFAIGNLVVAVALFRYQLFDLVPIARDAIIEQIENPIIVLDRQDRIVDMNPAARSLLYSAKIGQRIQEAARDWPEVVAELEGKEAYQTEIVGDVEGDVRYFDLNLLPLFDKKQKLLGHLIHAHEISDRKYTEQALKARTKDLEDILDRLEAAQKELIDGERFAALGKMTSVVSHELRNPLGTVRNALFSIRDAVKGEGAHRIERAISLADRNVVRCDLIIEELLNYTRDSPTEVEDTDLDNWISGFLAELQDPPSVTVEFNPGFGDRVPIEREKFRRVLINLISNSTQAIEEGRPLRNGGSDELEPGRITLTTSRRGGSAVIAVRDNGGGIPDNALNKIFEPLYSTRKIGVGLGLAIVKKTVDDHGGTIEVESTCGEGTEVAVIIPEHRAEL